ncbi:putative COMMD2 protein [Paratrimastix pyriformis]|uniref:COMMD2 protein n=1 Tax=Paratrimastix pyriformis TaxID=342808 RepID=A0ABQ8UFY5_9EUKA|nr:putative COMMD2 protein [Paratrimastix pyriformis]
MLILFSDKHKQDLSFLTQLSEEFLHELCQKAVEFIVDGGNEKIFAAAARTLQIDEAVIRNLIDGVSFLLVESSKLQISERDFNDSVAALSYPEPLAKALLQLYLDNRGAIREKLASLPAPIPHYKNLEWRLEAQVASRLHPLGAEVEPAFTLRLATSNVPATQTAMQGVLAPASNDAAPGAGQATTQVILGADVANLRHLYLELDRALREVQSVHARRVMRYVK